ncbi:MAG: 4-hydroxy-3-methylbut-2-enyl diphosphate reductase [Verrucomicrobiaceae bacterium]|nr:MAG: 4-hydroxy-3-methylbut-2-enyl diphosphate reductase [Verrucomicrobiaceae bacterium]
MQAADKNQEKKKRKNRRVNVRTPEVMPHVQTEVEEHYRSRIVEKFRQSGGRYTIGTTTVILAKEFGFCYGVERAIDLAYATRQVFPDRNVYLIGEIIHNPEVNKQLQKMGIMNLAGDDPDATINDLIKDDIVIVPAFGAEIQLMDQIDKKGCQIVDTTCGDVMRVWKRVRNYAKEGFTAIIHGKADHEETRATASRATDSLGGHYLVILTKEDCEYVCNYIMEGGVKEDFLQKFNNAISSGFDPDKHLDKIGVANQTTMLKGETEAIQQKLYEAVKERDREAAKDSFQFFDTICGATQERQDALYEMLKLEMDMLLVVGGYNSSNTTHLVEIGEEKIPSFFIRNAKCLESFEQIVHFDLDKKIEKTTYSGNFFNNNRQITIGITAGASCPNNLIEETILRIFEIRGHDIGEFNSV